MAKSETRKIEANFTQFIGGFAVQTLVHLGRMSNPVTNATSVDLPNAKYSIDILSILQEKTKGNLTPEESEYLSNLLRDLRMEYVAVSGKANAPEAAPPAGSDGTADADKREG